MANDSDLTEQVKADARRWQWWRRAGSMRVTREEPGEWTCWITIGCIPYRSKTDDPDELTDQLIERFPLPQVDSKES